jgi:SAM-dependent methyltransferase
MENIKYPYPGATNAAAYEWLNRCTDPERKVETFIAKIMPWKRKTVLDIGAGSGFHSAWFAQVAERVIAVEPDPRLRRQLFARLAQSPDWQVSVLAASAESIPLPDRCVDLAYARFAYFFGTPECLPGLAEVMRLLLPGGHFFVIDAIPEWGEWGRLTAKAYPKIFHRNYHADQTAFYQAHGFSVYRIETVFRAPNKKVLNAVFKMDFPHVWKELVRVVDSLELSYGIAVFYRRKIDRKPNQASQRIAHPRRVQLS